MTEVEYSQLQHIIYSEMEVQDAAAGGPEDARSNLAGSHILLASAHAHAHGEAAYGEEGAPAGCSGRCAPGAGPHGPGGAVHSQNHVDLQEIKMILMSDPLPATFTADRTPTSAGEVPGPVLAKARNAAPDRSRDHRGDSGDLRRGGAETRPNPPARVCLEKRFGCSPCDISRRPETQAPSGSLSNFLSGLHHPSELLGVSKGLKLGRTKVAPRPVPIEFTYPLYGASLCNSAENTGTSAQSIGSFSQFLESAKHQELIPRNFTFSYQQDTESFEPTVLTQTKSLAEQVWVNQEEILQARRRASSRRSRARGQQAAGERRALSDIQNGLAAPGGEAADGTLRKSRGYGENSLRRERHNSMERDRRRRIRICCDELNILVPFCTPETDKATTLQWTTAFLKYIDEVHGDSLKKEFENAFCGKTGKRLKPGLTVQPMPHEESPLSSLPVEQK
ncbi:TCFL5 protein, partial [Atractosteus spatula]|nr:TCFL5 protein [Atractosteus spatula]